jgi:hypothetical protein
MRARALVVSESSAGATRDIAEAVAAGLAWRLPVDVIAVRTAPRLVGDDVRLLVVGGPSEDGDGSHAHRLGAGAARTDGGATSELIGLREWLADLDVTRSCPLLAVFDTAPATHGWVRRLTSVARSARRLLRRRGFRSPIPTQTFLIEAVDGTLLPGEVRRARRWGAELAARATRSAAA